MHVKRRGKLDLEADSLWRIPRKPGHVGHLYIIPLQYITVVAWWYKGLLPNSEVPGLILGDCGITFCRVQKKNGNLDPKKI